MHDRWAMQIKLDRNKLEESTRLVGTTSWAAIGAGAVVALAIQVLLLLLGLALSLSVGDHIPAGGYAFWAVIVEMFALAVGSALAAHVAHPGRELGGITAGVMTWATFIVLSIVVGRYALFAVASTSTTAWAGFFGALFGLAAAIFGGIVGSTGSRHIHLRRRHNTLPMGTTQTGPM
jgi:hypothetical protein